VDRYKDITVGEGPDARNFRINRLPADVGSWIAFQILSSGGKLPEEDFHKAQGHLLASIQQLTVIQGQNAYTPIYVRDSGIWADKQLEFDLPAVINLTMQAMAYNFESFFMDSRIKPILDGYGFTRSNPSER
jgi:hypothetical protein